MKPLKIFFIVLLVVLIVIQFVRPAENVSAIRSQNDIAAIYNQPDNVRTILDKACNDCHSNNTKYPWYANIQPVAWWLGHHIEEGKRELNFNEFGSYPVRRQYHKLEEVAELVEEGEMPLSSYTLAHAGARLTDKEKAALTHWAESIRAEIKAKYPLDSLIRRR